MENKDFITRRDLEIAASRMKHTIKIMWIFIFSVFGALVGSNVAWIVHFFG